MSFRPICSSKNLNKTHRNSDIPQSTAPGNRERTFLPSFGRASRSQASLTIEAALTLPVFLFFVCCMIHFLLLISLQGQIQLRLDEAQRQIGKRAYVADESEILSLISSNSFTIRSAIMTDELKSLIDGSRIEGGTGGFHTLLSSYDKKTSELDVFASYKYSFPYFPAKIASFTFMQRSFGRAWTGEPLGDGGADAGEDEDEGRTVYITPTGKAWHATASCSYLDLSIRPVQLKTISELRNKSGGIYYQCKCFVPGSAVVYITDYGALYHSDTECSALKRTVLAVDISEVGDRHPCKKCAASEGD